MKEKQLRTFPHRWGEGKVHRLLYNRENQLWYLACRKPGREPQGDVVEGEEVTCRRCNPKRDI